MSNYKEFEKIVTSQFGAVNNIVFDLTENGVSACFTDDKGQAWEMEYKNGEENASFYPISMKEIKSLKDLENLDAKAEELIKDSKKNNAKEVAIARRAKLKALSNDLKSLNLITDGDNISVNDLLRKYYEDLGHTDLKTFHQWKKEGYRVKKGEKALPIWGKPIDINSEKEPKKNETKEKEDDKKDFFPIALLFSRKQVVKIK